MGCGASGKVSSVRDPQQNLSGIVQMFLESAVLVNHKPWYGELFDAYVVFRFGKTTLKSQISNIDGLRPFWGQLITFQKISEDELILVEIWSDHPILDDILIGSTVLSLLSIKHGGSLQVEADILDPSKQYKGKLFLTLNFTCNYPNNPIAQVIDSSGFTSLKLKSAFIDLYQGVEGLSMNVLSVISLNRKQKGMLSALKTSSNIYTFNEEFIFYRNEGEDSIEISFFDYGNQTIFELIGTAYISVCRSLLHIDQRKVVLWRQGRCVGTISIELQFTKSQVLTKFMELVKDNDLQTNEVYDLKKQGHAYYIERIINKVSSIKKAANRPELQLEQQVTNSFFYSLLFLLLKRKAIDQCKKDLGWLETPQEGNHSQKYSDGSEYIGDFSNHLRHGNGKLLALNGKFIYEGAWVNDAFHGKGKLTSNEIEYDGEFSLGVYHGKGKHSFKKGQQIQASYDYGQFDGEHKILEENKILFEGIFEKGQIIKVKNLSLSSAERENDWILSPKELTFEQLNSFHNNPSQEASSFQFLKPGIRIPSGCLFSQEFQYCYVLTNRGTAKKMEVKPIQELWNNSQSDPNSRPFFFWINVTTKKFEVVGFYGVQISVDISPTLKVNKIAQEILIYWLTLYQLANTLIKLSEKGELLLEDQITKEQCHIYLN